MLYHHFQVQDLLIQIQLDSTHKVLKSAFSVPGIFDNPKLSNLSNSTLLSLDSDWGRFIQSCLNGSNVHTIWPRLNTAGLSGFQQQVYQTLMNVNFLISYADLAQKAGCPGAARAVGTAMARNPFPLIVPCHRVVRANGSLGRYSSGGIVVKQYLVNRLISANSDASPA